MDYRICSIGTLSAHPLWNEQQAARTAHATTTLIRSGDKTLLVDPGLPDQAVAAHLNERAGLTPQAVTDVFLTTFRPAHRRALEAFAHAKWWISRAEREAVGAHLVSLFQQAEDEEAGQVIKHDIALLQRCQAAPDQLAEHVDLFPLHGYTPGTCGLLVSLPSATVLVAGDAVATAEHLAQGQVLSGAYDLDAARASFAEAVEIADWIIPGHDNLLPNLTRRYM
jgi:glyoxylase-like metal-dependent hydrolase (beta-lactamase superfamily II)